MAAGMEGVKVMCGCGGKPVTFWRATLATGTGMGAMMPPLADPAADGGITLGAARSRCEGAAEFVVGSLRPAMGGIGGLTGILGACCWQHHVQTPSFIYSAPICNTRLPKDNNSMRTQ